PWCDKIAAESNNKMKCQIFPAMQLGGTPAQLIDQAKDGVVDIVFTLPGYTAGRFPVMEVFELPFLVPSAEAGAKAAWDFYQKYGQKEFANVKPLMFAV
ncbi:C4-dicarboxylate ABC transporter, partial [Escherichia coli]|nr:C4-dicarboxylate ABC transporter [Escherichia coli]